LSPFDMMSMKMG